MTPEQQVAEMEHIIGYTFNDRHLALECLYHGGLPICFEGALVTPERNERLAVLGDSILDTVLLDVWYRTRHSAGFLLTRGQWKGIIHDDLVTNKALAIRGRALGLDACVIKDPGTVAVSKDMIATTLEAIIAAVFRDSGATGLDTVREVMDRLGLFNHEFFLMIINVQDLDPG